MLWPVHAPQPVPTGTDKLMHLAAFGFLVLPAAFSRRVPRGLLFGGLFIGVSVFGGAIELIQPHFGRSADFNDWGADMLGAGIGLVLAGFILRVKHGSNHILKVVKLFCFGKMSS